MRPLDERGGSLAETLTLRIWTSVAMDLGYLRKKELSEQLNWGNHGGETVMSKNKWGGFVFIRLLSATSKLLEYEDAC